MITVDLRAACTYPPVKEKSLEELFALASAMARALPDIEVLTPVGDAPDEVVTMPSRLFHRSGVAVF